MQHIILLQNITAIQCQATMARLNMNLSRFLQITEEYFIIWRVCVCVCVIHFAWLNPDGVIIHYYAETGCAFFCCSTIFYVVQRYLF